LDQQHADVLAHRQEELAQVLGHALVVGQLLELRQLGDSVDQLGDVGPEVLLNLLDRDQRVLDRVVEQRGDDRLLVELEVGHQTGDFDRVAEIGVAARPLLRAVLLHGINIGTVEQRLVGVRIVGFYTFDEFVLTQHSPDVRCAIVGSKGKAARNPRLLRVARRFTTERTCLARTPRSSNARRCWRANSVPSISAKVFQPGPSRGSCSRGRSGRWSSAPTNTRRCAAYPSCARRSATTTSASRDLSWRQKKSSSPPARPARSPRRSSPFSN